MSSIYLRYFRIICINFVTTLIDRFSLMCKLLISVFMSTFDRCGSLLEHNIICGHNATCSDDHIIANSLPNIHLSKRFNEHCNG